MRDLSATDYEWNDDATLAFEAASVIDAHSSFDGTFHSQRDLRVEGNLKGSVTCEGTLFVTEGATVTANVDAEHINVAGDLSGEIRCRGRLQILPSGKVKARVSTSALVIQEGAVYEGQLEMAGIERLAPRPLRARPTAEPVNIESANADRQAGSGTTFIRRLGSPEAPWDGNQADAEGENAATPQGEDGSAG